MQEGESEPFASGFVPPEVLKSIYEDPAGRSKPFDLVLMEGEKSIGTLQLLLKPSGFVQVEEAQHVASIPEH